MQSRASAKGWASRKRRARAIAADPVLAAAAAQRKADAAAFRRFVEDGTPIAGAERGSATDRVMMPAALRETLDRALAAMRARGGE